MTNDAALKDIDGALRVLFRLRRDADDIGTLEELNRARKLLMRSKDKLAAQGDGQ